MRVNLVTLLTIAWCFICLGCQNQTDYTEYDATELKSLVDHLNVLIEQKESETKVTDSLNLLHIQSDSIARYQEIRDSINNSILQDRVLASLSPMGFVRLNTAEPMAFDDNRAEKVTREGLGLDKKEDKLSYNWYEHSNEADTMVVIKGNIKGKADNYVKVYMSKPYEDDFVRNLKVDTANNFHRVVTLKEAGFYTLTHKSNKYNVYIAPGDTLDLTIDHDTDEGLEFNGKTADVNNYLRCRHLQDKAMAPNEWKLNNQEFKDFEEEVDYYKNVKLNNLDDFLAQDVTIAKQFIAHEKADIELDWGRKHLKYQKINIENSDKAKRSNGKYFKKLSLSDSSNFYVYNFRKFVFEYFDFFSKRKLVDKYGEDGQYNFRPEERAMMRYKDINYYFKSKKVREFLKTDLVYSMIKELKMPSVNPIVLKARKDVKTEDYLAVLDMQYKKYVPLRDGSFAPDFTLTDRSGNTIERDDLRGKYVYMAVWASWCAPCKIEQPHLERLKSEYSHNRKLKILSVSIDKERSKWERALDYREISAPQYIAPGNWNSSFARAFDVKSVPKYILIDPDGQIVDLSTSKP